MSRLTVRRLPALVALVVLLVGVLPAGAALAAEARDPSDFACPEGEVPDQGFTDTEGNFHESNIDCLVWYGFARGTTATTYAPERSVTRGQMARFLANLIAGAGIELPSDPPDAFTDDDDTEHERPIDQLAELGVVEGTSPTTYQPNRAVNRAQMASFLNRAYAEVTGAPLTSSQNHFTDDEGNHHEDNINAVAEAGIAAGTSDTTYEPGEPVRRDQMATFLVRETDLLVEEGFISVPVSGNPTVLQVPELVRVEEVSINQLRFVFDEAVADSLATAAFGLYGVSADRTEASAVTRDGDRAVIATFTAEAVRDASLAGVAGGAVQDADGNLSPEGSVGVQPVELDPGTTIAPDLVGVVVREGEAEFTFDEPAFSLVTGGYRIVLTDGSQIAADGGPAEDEDGTETHTMTFSDLTAQQAEQAAFGYVNPDTVSDEEGDGNPLNGAEGNTNVLQMAEVSATGLVQGRPNLIRVELVDDSTAVYTFDEAVVRNEDEFGQAQGGFRLYTVDASVLSPESVTRTDNKTFTATFAEGSITELVSGAFVQANTVAASNDGDTNRAQEIGFDVSYAAGDTAAAELLSAEVEEDPETNVRTVTFTFDADIAAIEDGTQFHVYHPDGTSAAFTEPASFPPSDSGCRIDEDTTRVVCTVDEGEEPELWAFLADAVLATVEAGSVETEHGHANPEGAAVLRGSVTNPDPEPAPEETQPAR